MLIKRKSETSYIVSGQSNKKASSYSALLNAEESDEEVSNRTRESIFDLLSEYCLDNQ